MYPAPPCRRVWTADPIKVEQCLVPRPGAWTLEDEDTRLAVVPHHDPPETLLPGFTTVLRPRVMHRQVRSMRKHAPTALALVLLLVVLARAEMLVEVAQCCRHLQWPRARCQAATLGSLIRESSLVSTLLPHPHTLRQGKKRRKARMAEEEEGRGRGGGHGGRKERAKPKGGRHGR